MVPIKRKGASGEESATGKAQKRARVGADEKKKDQRKEPGRASKKEVSKEPSRSSSSVQRDLELTVVRDEEPSFPRGGGSVLTPLERKQIQIQATRDVLFEQKGSGKAIVGVDNEDTDGDVDIKDAAKEAVSGKMSRKTKGKKREGREIFAKQGVRVEGLSFKRIVVGSMVLGQVFSITPHDIGLALPNNLTGYIPLTSISKGLDQKIEKVLNEDEEEDEEEDGSEDTLDLKTYFHLGQYLRAYVTSTGRAANDTTTAKSKNKIELSIDPRQTNSGLVHSDLVEDSVVQASVVSVEDRGLVMDLGIEGSDIKGFMSSKEIDPEVDYSSIKEGAVFLCIITGFNASRSVFKLAGNLRTAASITKAHYLSSAPTINSYLPGTAAEILLTDVLPRGMIGNIMGLLDTTVDLVHSGANSGAIDLTKKFQNGAKIKGRITCTFPASEPFKVGFSILDHVLKFTAVDHSLASASPSPTIAAIVPDTKIVKVEPGLGVYVEIGSTKHLGFVHISKLSDETVESISNEQGLYKVGTVHEARVVGYNAFDDLFLLSFERSVIDQPFIRLEDVTVGAVVKGKIEKIIIGPSGMDGMIMSLADGITGLVPSMHFADAQLQHPEKKFREGMTISARILSVNLTKRQIRLTLKKSLLNSDSVIWKDYNDIVPEAQSPGTIVNIQSHGAVVQFYGSIRGFLPVSEMSEAYIKDASQHFRQGQVVNVHALSVDALAEKLVVSCKDPSTVSDNYREAFDEIQPGLLVTGTVFEKSADDVLLKLDGSGVIARFDAHHLTDSPGPKQNSTLAKIRVGQKLPDLLVLKMKRAHRLIRVTNKPSLKKALKQGALPVKFEDIQEGAQVTGFIRNTTPHGIFVEYLGGLTGLLPKRLISDEHVDELDYGMLKTQPITLTVHQIDRDFRRFTLTMKPGERTSPKVKARTKPALEAEDAILNPVDESIKSVADLSFGKVTKARIVSVKETQINVVLADNIQGRIDVSEVFDGWEDIKDRKRPLQIFRTRQILPVRILGVHDARSHKFLPISHRSGKYPVFELSAKPSFIKSEDANPLSLDQVGVGSSWTAFINNITDECLWVNLSPNVRGRIRAIDLTDDLSALADIEGSFPVGSALKVRVTATDIEKGRLDLTGKQGVAGELSFDKLTKGMVLPGRLTKITEKQVIVQLSDSIVGAVGLTDMADDYSKIDISVYRKNEILRTCIVDIDKPNKKVHLSLRPSKVLSSSLRVQDSEIVSASQLKVNDIVRGFVRRVADNGVFVSLGQNVTAYVRISDLSDSYIKEWKDEYQVDQLVKGRIILNDLENNKLQMSLKESVLDANYKTPITLRDLKPGQIVTGRVRNVEEYGAFIAIDGSANISGLCHRSEMAEQRVGDARKLFERGDAVKAKILKIDFEKEKISFGLKASYFIDEEDSDSTNGEDDLSMGEAGGVEPGSDSESDGDDDNDDDNDEDITLQDLELEGASKSDEDSEQDQSMVEDGLHDEAGGLDAGGFDWTGNVGTEEADIAVLPAPAAEAASKKKKLHRKPEIQIDQTGDLDARGPQCVADYERLLLGESDSSILWLQYMAFQLELGEIDKAREIAERAIHSISIGQDTEKLNVWVALLNLENTYGDEETLEEVFKRACQFNDTQEVYERMISIFIQSGKNEKADELFQTTLKKKIFSSPKLFINYATFLFDAMAVPDRGRALLPRALQSLTSHTHIELTSKFGQLEFRSENGDMERGRTVFEGLLSSFPKRVDLWNVLLDLEIKAGDAEQVRRLFQRVLGISSSSKSHSKKGGLAPAVDEGKKRLKSKQARFFFKKWLSFEEKLASAEGGNGKMVEEVKARAAEYVEASQEE